MRQSVATNERDRRTSFAFLPPSINNFFSSVCSLTSYFNFLLEVLHSVAPSTMETHKLWSKFSKHSTVTIEREEMNFQYTWCDGVSGESWLCATCSIEITHRNKRHTISVAVCGSVASFRISKQLFHSIFGFWLKILSFVNFNHGRIYSSWYATAWETNW